MISRSLLRITNVILFSSRIFFSNLSFPRGLTRNFKDILNRKANTEILLLLLLFKKYTTRIEKNDMDKYFMELYKYWHSTWHICRASPYLHGCAQNVCLPFPVVMKFSGFLSEKLVKIRSKACYPKSISYFIFINCKVGFSIFQLWLSVSPKLIKLDFLLRAFERAPCFQQSYTF